MARNCISDQLSAFRFQLPILHFRFPTRISGNKSQQLADINWHRQQILPLIPANSGR
jgi:hypothetical protein